MRAFTYLVVFLVLLIPFFAQADNPLNRPKQLSQNFSDCQTSILSDQWIREDAVCLKARIFGRQSGELVKLEAEIILIDEEFSDVPNHQATQFCASPCNSNISINQLSNGQRYRWQVRTINKQDEVSDWVEFSSSQFAFGIDQTPPQGTIASSEVVRVNEEFEVTVSGQDNVAMKNVCYREENDYNWTCYRCSAHSSECEFSFLRSESSLQRYKYSGYLMDMAGQGSFTEPPKITVSVQTDPAVVTLAVAELSGNQATFAGYVTDLGHADEVKVWFEYQSDENNQQTSDVLRRDQTGAFQISVDNLDPYQVYRLRPVIENGVGRDYGQEIMSTELIANGYFETGTLDGWQTARPGHYSLTKEAYSGEYSGLFGFKDYAGHGTSILSQNIVIPQAAGQVNLSFDYNFYTYDYCSQDAFSVRLRNAQGEILETYEEWCCSTDSRHCRNEDRKVESGWTNISRNMRDYVGQTVTVSFEVWRRDDDRRSWAIIDNVSLTYVPIAPPTVSTLEPEDIHTGSVTMVGDLIDNGQDEATQVWFVWDEKPGQDWQDYAHRTGSLTRQTAGEFVISIGNLLSDTTYYFRAVAQNNAGLSFGEEKTFTTLYATAGGWRLPDYHVDVENRWSYEKQAYDWDTATRARNDGYTTQTDWRGYLEFHLNEPLRCDKIRISGTGEGSGSGDIISEIYIRYSGEKTWRLVFQGILPENHRFIEVGFSSGLVESARVRRKHPFNPGGGAWVSTIGEFHFYEVPDEPITEATVHTLEAVKIERNSAILKGRISDDGGELAETRFKYWTEDNPDQIYYTEWDQGLSGETNGWATGEVFGRMVTGLEEGKNYGFKAQARNSVSSVPAEGDSKIFTTGPAQVGWVSPTDSGGTWGGYEHYGYDDIVGTYTSINRGGLGSSLWSPWLEFYRPGIFSDRIRFRLPEARSGDTNIIQSIQIMIIIDGRYQEVYNSKDFPTGEWIEVDISSLSFDNRGNPLVVEGASVRMQMTGNHYFPFEFDELEFWKLPESPEVITGSARASLEENELKVEVSGELTYFGGVEQAEAWFEWRKDNEKYQDRNRTDPVILTSPGAFWAEIGHRLDRGSSYYFRAAARNEFTTAYGSEERFLTEGCRPNQETECVAYEEGSYVCSYTVECRDDGLWARCDSGNCAIDDHCHCTDYLDPKPGYEIIGSSFCGENCLCDYSQCQYSGAQPSAINLEVTEPDYCYWDPYAIFSWEFIGPAGSSQTAYRLQVSQNANFANFVVDSGVISSGSHAYAIEENILDYNQNYYWRLMVWDAAETSSSWISGPSFGTPRHRYPRIDFTWQQVDAESSQVIQFKDQSTVFDSAVADWSWEFEDGSPSSVTGQSDPIVTFADIGSKNVVLAVTDSSGYACQGSDTVEVVAQTIPGYKEVPPVE